MGDGFPWQEPGWRAALSLRWCMPCCSVCITEREWSVFGAGPQAYCPSRLWGPLHDLRGPWSPTPTPSSSRSELGFKSTSRGTRGTTQPLGG